MNLLNKDKRYYIHTKNYLYIFEDVNKFIQKSILLDKLGIKHDVEIIDFYTPFRNWTINSLNMIDLSQARI